MFFTMFTRSLLLIANLYKIEPPRYYYYLYYYYYYY